MKKRSIVLLLISILPYTILSQNPSFTWAKEIKGFHSKIVCSITADAKGNVYTTGHFKGMVDFDPDTSTFNLQTVNGSGNINDIFIQKLDSNGNFKWAKRIGGQLNDESYSICHDSSSNIYIAGRFQDTVDFDPDTSSFTLGTNNHSGDMFIAKFDESGNFKWAKRIGGRNDDRAYSIKSDPNGDLYITGFFSDSTDFDPGAGVHYLATVTPTYNEPFVLKLDSNGTLKWVTQMVGTAGYGEGLSLSLDQQGNIFAAGMFGGTVDFGGYSLHCNGQSGFCLYIQKLNSNGTCVWAKFIDADIVHNASNTNLNVSMATDVYGNIYTTCYFQSNVDIDPGPATNFITGNIILKLNSTGNFVWAKSIPFTSTPNTYAYSHSIITDAVGNVYTAGIFSSVMDFDPGPGTYNLTVSGNSSFDSYINRLDSGGHFVYAMQMGGKLYEEGCSMTIDSQNNILVAGIFSSTVADFNPSPSPADTFYLHGSGNNSDAFILKLSYGTVGLTEYVKNDNVIIYPNPSNGIINFENETNITGEVRIEIYNIIGAIIYSKEKLFSNLETIDISNQPPGIYNVKIILDSQKYYVKKVVLIK